MKKNSILTAFAGMALCLAIVSCEDVPAPYEIAHDPVNVINPAGEGTATNPYNVEALDSLFENDLVPSSGLEVYVKGIVSSISAFDTENYGTATYYISDTGKTTKQFYVYRGMYLNGAKFTSPEDLSVGDTLLIKGTVLDYNGTYEFKQNDSQIVMKGGNIPEPTPVKPVPSYKDFSNGGFEAWTTDSLPTDWDGEFTKVKVSKSVDSKFGSYAAKVDPPSANQNLATCNLSFDEGEYRVTYWAKAAGEGVAQTRPCYVKKGGSTVTGLLSKLVTLSTEWQQITSDTLKVETSDVYSITMQFPSKNKVAVIVDEFVIEKLN